MPGLGTVNLSFHQLVMLTIGYFKGKFTMFYHDDQGESRNFIFQVTLPAMIMKIISG